VQKSRTAKAARDDFRPNVVLPSFVHRRAVGLRAAEESAFHRLADRVMHVRECQGTQRRLLTSVVFLFVNKRRIWRDFRGDGISQWEIMRVRFRDEKLVELYPRIFEFLKRYGIE
jgi:hypothetical protein